MSTEYWLGNRQATLQRDQVRADWGRPGTEHSGTAIALANRAFEVYYTARRNINACTDSSHKNAMLQKLEEAGRSGWGIGVNDLEESFEHLERNQGIWTDGSTSNYFGGPNKIFPNALVTGPQGPVNFLKAVDANVEELRRILDRFNQQTQQLAQAQQNDNWTRIGDITGEIQTWGERAKPFLWWAPNAEQRLGQVVSFAGALSNMHTALTTYTNSRSAGFDSRTSAAIAALRTAVGWVPVLGEFYGRAVDLIPGLATWFRGLVQDRGRRIDAAAAGRSY